MLVVVNERLSRSDLVRSIVGCSSQSVGTYGVIGIFARRREPRDRGVDASLWLEEGLLED